MSGKWGNTISKITKSEIILLLLILGLIFVLRLPSSTAVVIDWDESLYFLVAQDIVNGGVPYQNFWEHKGPLLFFLLTPPIKLFGKNIFALRIYTTLYLLVSMIFLYVIAKRVFHEKICLIPPLAYGLFFLSFGGLASNGELFMMLPTIIAALCIIVYMQSEKQFYLKPFLCGFFSATAVLIKPTALFTIALFPSVVVMRAVTAKESNVRLLLKELLWYVGGGAALTLTVLGYFAVHDTAFDLFYGFYLANARLVHTTTIWDALVRLFVFLNAVIVVKPNGITVLALGCGLFLMLKRDIHGEKKNIVWFTAALTLVSLVGVCWGRNMYSHYFLQMGLAFSLLIALAVSMININARDLNMILYTVLLILIVNIPFRELLAFPDRFMNRKNDVHYKVADYIAANTTESDTIFVLGGQPILYFLANRKAPTKYFFWLHHWGWREKILHIKDETLRKFSKNKPRYFVYRQDNRRVAYLEKFMLEHYHGEATYGEYTLYVVNSED